MNEERCLCYRNNQTPTLLRIQATNGLKDLLTAKKEENDGTVPAATYSYSMGCDVGNCQRTFTANLTLEEATPSVPELSAVVESLFSWEGSCALALHPQIEISSV